MFFPSKASSSAQKCQDTEIRTLKLSVLGRVAHHHTQEKTIFDIYSHGTHHLFIR
jgi:hypothetical protein